MRDAGRRPVGRLCCWALVVLAASGFGLRAFAVPAAPQSGPATTTVSDTVYLADECLNASTWAKNSPQPSAVGRQ